MQLLKFRIQMYKRIIDSGWVQVTPLTVVVGKNESGKTALLKALHKFNPFNPSPYEIAREWPRGRRDERTDQQIVCSAEFELADDEVRELKAFSTEQLTNRSDLKTLSISKNYAGQFEVHFPKDVFPNNLHPSDIDAQLANLPELPNDIGEDFQQASLKHVQEAKTLAAEGRFNDLDTLCADAETTIRTSLSQVQPQQQNENQYLGQLIPRFKELSKTLRKELTIHHKAHDYIVSRLPTFVYMDEYRTFQGTAYLDQVKQRRDKNQLSEEDKTLLTILALSHLQLDDEVKKSAQPDREERQYDLSDASATLTKAVENHWGQSKYEIRFGADGNQFFTFVRSENDKALIRLEERSRGFQWFFSFDLLLMHETRGTMKDCVLLLDEPGLHLHPEGQRDLLKRLDAYAQDNVLIYTSHLPFMIDLQQPQQIRILSESKEGTVVTDDLTQTQPEGKLTLQAALGIGGATSFLLSQRNLVVEGVDDYWYLTALSDLFARNGKSSLPEDLFITAAGGASEVTYIATFMVGQGLDVIALYDTDTAGKAAQDNFLKKWLTRYKDRHAEVLSLGPAAGVNNVEFSIEDLFAEDFYLSQAQEYYKNQLLAVGQKSITLPKGEQLIKRIESFFSSANLKFNKGTIAKRICTQVRKMKSIDELPQQTVTRAETLFASINALTPKKPSNE